ncbi:hypothetical protein [Vibrio splendidus]|uniref:hypothetical protein n=1 Tax=Vibrio splendidus TaxID=29497 RepID=UPI000C82CDB9|nr:hypothetical protein [Vibrio splendidus]PMI27878.1 hypothetical protein BCU48_17800 [Vibrio splendidus]
MDYTNQTIKKLSEFKDAAKFERLATDYLRASNPHKYQDTSHLGVNPQGSTVKAPLDGFATYEENGELGIAGLEHTTTDIKRLHDKFLKDLSKVKPKDPQKGATGTEGDLRKAIDAINSYKSQYPDIKKATVALVSTLDPKPNTILDATVLAKSNNIDLEIHGGSRIANYLDTTAKGQYLRKLYLNQNPDKLSIELLRDITKKQIDEYSKFVDTELIVHRDSQCSELNNHSFLVGESGVGKSIIAYSILQKNFNNGSAGIFLSDTLISESNSLEEAISKQLSRYESNLEYEAGSAALDICPAHLPLVIVVEDINNSDSPIKTLQKLLNWIPKGRQVKWRLICPVYPNYIASLKHDEKEKIDDIAKYIEVYSEDEAIKAINLKLARKGDELSEIEIKSISRSLGNDPLLISLSELEEDIEVSDIIDKYISDDIIRISTRFDSIYEYEINDLYCDLIRNMLIHRNFRPKIQQIVKWYDRSPAKIDVLKKILKHGSAIYISNKNGKDSISFRHDRISLSISSNVIAQDLDTPDDFDYLCDPFYSEAVALALIKRDLDKSSIDFLRRNNPLSLFNALMITSKDLLIDSSYLIDSIKFWITETNENNSPNVDIRFEAMKILSQIDSKVVISLTDLFKLDFKNDFFFEARFRNGSLEAGLNLFLRHDLGIRIVGRRELLQHVFLNHGCMYISQLGDLLCSEVNCDETIKASLIFAGYLGDCRLEEAIKKRWDKTNHKGLILREFLWAAARCHHNDEALLTQIFDQWASLSDKPDDYGMSDLNSFASHSLDWAFESYVPVNALAYFANRAREDKKLEWSITYMCRVFGEPIILEYLVEFLEKYHEESQDQFFFVYTHFSDHLRRKNILPYESKFLLEKIIKDSSSSLSKVISASKLYGAVESKNDLGFLCTFNEQDVLFKWSVFERAKRGDLSVANSIIKLIPDDKRFWWQSGRYIWNEYFTAYLSSEISKIGYDSDEEVDYILSELLINNDSEISSKILLENWPKIKGRIPFIQAAIYTCHPKLLELVHEEVQKSSRPNDIFNHVLMTFGYMTKDRKGITKQQQVKTLLRYKDYLNDMDIYSLWDACNKNKWFKLRKRYLDDLVSKTDYIFTTSIDSNDLEKAYSDENKSYWLHLNIWYERHIESGFEQSELTDAIIIWFKTKKDIMSFNIVQQLARKIFTRKDMLKLRNVALDLKELEEPCQNLEFYIKFRSLY